MEEQSGKQKRTRRERFLSDMERAVPWARLVALIGPFYPKGERGRPPLGIERKLRVYFLQQWFALADEAFGDALYDSRAMRAFVGGEGGARCHETYGLEVCGIHEHGDALRIRSLLVRLFPRWRHVRYYYKDWSRERGWKVIVSRERD